MKNKPTVYQRANINLKFNNRNKKLETFNSKHMIRDNREFMRYQDLCMLIGWLTRVRDEIEASE